MIRAMIFDLDGTLVQTERLKARSYAQATVELCPYSLDEASVIEAFKAVVGLSRREVALALIDRFDLTDKLQARYNNSDNPELWQTFVDIRLRYYNQLIADTTMLREYQWTHNVALLEAARADGCLTALATMSHREQVRHVLDALRLTDAFDFVATRDDVERGKPHPEIYQMVEAQLKIPASDSLVIEDSVNGVKAALAAGMHVIAVATDFTRDTLHDADGLDGVTIVDDPSMLLEAVQQFVTLKKAD